jgi:hypothetical protein
VKHKFVTIFNEERCVRQYKTYGEINEEENEVEEMELGNK